MSKNLKLWLLVAIVTTAMSSLVYAVVQQNLRLGANDPQIQMAEDMASELSDGQAPETVIPTTKIDMAKSLAPFVIIFDNSGKALASSTTLDSQTPTIPAGVLEYAKKNGENRLTWQPKIGVRNATVVTPYTGTHSGYVLVGRSLREVEERVNMLGWYVATAWISTLVATALVILLYPRVRETK